MSEITVYTQTTLVNAMALKHGYAPYIFAFLNPRSKNWKYVRELCEKHGKFIVEDNSYFVFFEGTEDEIYVMNSIINIVRGWTTVYFFVNNTSQNLYNLQWMDCYITSLQAKDLDSYCLSIDDIYSNDFRTIVPCKFLLGWIYRINSYHPSSLKDQLQAMSIGRCNCCPNFDINKFQCIKIEKTENKEKFSWRRFFGNFFKLLRRR